MAPQVSGRSEAVRLTERLAAVVQRFIRVRFWKMDIHRTAQIDPTASIDRTWPRGVHIAAGCRIDEQAVVLTHDFTRGLYLDTRIGERTHIGARAIIMPGVVIGADCEIAPGALVTRDMPDGACAVGNPAEIHNKLNHAQDAALG